VLTALRDLLAHPLTAGLDIDDPRVTEIRREIILTKKPLRRIYDEWYARIAAALPAGEGAIIELGSGGGFLGDVVDDVIATEVFFVRGVDVSADGRALPFRAGSVRAVVMVDVFHHIPDARRFLSEAARVLRAGGRVVMIEPWATAWSRLIYRHLHHEPFEPRAAQWSFPETGPLSGANGALPWIVFQRDRQIFERDYPELALREIRVLMPFRYLMTGGVSMRSVLPSFVFPAISILERLLSPVMRHLGMFAFIVVEKKPQ
jgi:SAM-dependent methyltransferase